MKEQDSGTEKRTVGGLMRGCHRVGVKIKEAGWERRIEAWAEGEKRGEENTLRGEITETERQRPGQEESSREHNLRERNGPRTTVALNSPV